MRTRHVKGSDLQEDDVWLSASGHMYKLRGLQRDAHVVRCSGDELGRVRSGSRRRELGATFRADEDVKILMTEE